MKHPNSWTGLLLLAVLAFGACTETIEKQHSTLEISSVGYISPYAKTKAVINGNTLPADDAARGIGLFVLAADGNAYEGQSTGYTNVKFVCSDGRWSTETPICLTETPGVLYGYFPYDINAKDMKAVPVKSSLNGTDYLFATPANVSSSNRSVSLSMGHALARLHLTIKKEADYKGEGILSKIKLEGKEIDITGTVDITDGTVKATKPRDEVGIVELAADGIIDESGLVQDILLVPTDSSEDMKDIKLSLTIDGVLIEVDLAGDSGIIICPGKQYDAELILENKGIKVTGVGVEEWGKSGGQQIQVGSNIVNITLSDDADIANDLLVNVVTTDDLTIKIETYSKSGKFTKCTVAGDAKCDTSIDETTGVCTFTISDISDKTSIEIGYYTCILTFIYDSTKGEVTLNDEEVEPGEKVAVKAGFKYLSYEPNEEEKDLKFFRWSDQYRKQISHRMACRVNIREDKTINVDLCLKDVVPGLFSIGENKKVFFSKGNLFCRGIDSDRHPTIKGWDFEKNQYDSDPKDFDVERNTGHISHFMWCVDASESVKQEYEVRHEDAGDRFFAASNFTVNGVNTWFMLSKDEWNYLFNGKGRENRYQNGVDVCGSKFCTILLPDDWNERVLSLKDFKSRRVYNEKTTPTWSKMESEGAVCLPGGGKRDGGLGELKLSFYTSGFYWSTTLDPGDRGMAHYVELHPNSIDLSRFDLRNMACSVRLATEYKE